MYLDSQHGSPNSNKAAESEAAAATATVADFKNTVAETGVGNMCMDSSWYLQGAMVRLDSWFLTLWVRYQICRAVGSRGESWEQIPAGTYRLRASVVIELGFFFFKKKKIIKYFTYDKIYSLYSLMKRTLRFFLFVKIKVWTCTKITWTRDY